ncbi:hypothetical protein VP1G_10901 [Cytospora mali]|uniref:Uncharacterized protein n=1 Tax=Cytospora mali TaxID=578113 RepID=A0A194V0U2_CYTMA|nr:hypothetical protein VP1G_10901 [Valsa mali var. pyri (nom. inval.)]
MMGVRLSLPLLMAFLAPSLTPTAAEDSSLQSTVSVYVPGYRTENWDDLAGSVIASDSIATTYTVFCSDSDDCRISGPVPFTFAEGPSTFRYSGSVESRLTAVISCELASTTAATCTEYSSYGSRFTEGNITGPTETTRTVTYSGTDVQWASLTMTSPAPASNPAQPTGDDPVTTVNPSDTAWFFPTETRTSLAYRRSDSRSPIALGFALMMAALLL